jgi:hypothetical protein
MSLKDWFSMNWVDRKFARENNVLRGAPELWQKVLTAVEDACGSFSKNYETPSVSRNTQNGHAVVVRAEFPPKDHLGTPIVNSVRIVFDEPQRLISATLNQNSPKKFLIASDENECFLSFQGDTVDADKLSELVLTDAFFKEPSIPQRGHIPTRSEWA